MEKHNINYQMLVMKYLENDLPPDEREKLELEIQKNPELMEEYKLQKDLNNFLKGKFMAEQAMEDTVLDKNKGAIENRKEDSAKSIENLSDELVNEHIENKEEGQYHTELKGFISDVMKQVNEKENKNLQFNQADDVKTSKKLRFRNKWIYLAATAAILIISISLMWYFGKTGSSSTLYASYYQPYHFTEGQDRGLDTIVEQTMDKATGQYKLGKYSEALAILNKVSDGHQKNGEVHFLKGLIQMETKDYMGASLEFRTIIDGFDTYKIESKWYLALCYLKLDKKEKARDIFKELSLSKNFYQKRAAEIVDLLRS